MKEISLALFTFLCFISHANYIYVDHSVPSNPLNDGSTWTKAFNDLEDALAASASGDVIRISAGTYSAPSGGYVLKDNVKILGGYPMPSALPDYLRNVGRNPNTHSDTYCNIE